MKTRIKKSTPQPADIVVAADGCRTIPEPIAVEIVRALFEHVGLDRLRESTAVGPVQFNDVSELCDLDLCDAMDVGFKLLSAEVDDDGIRAHVVKRVQAYVTSRVEAHLGSLAQPFAYRVGRSYVKYWPVASL